MFSAAVRVLARSVQIQLEEVAALSAAQSTVRDKGKARAADYLPIRDGLHRYRSYTPIPAADTVRHQSTSSSIRPGPVSSVEGEAGPSRRPSPVEPPVPSSPPSESGAVTSEIRPSTSDEARNRTPQLRELSTSSKLADVSSSRKDEESKRHIETTVSRPSQDTDHKSRRTAHHTLKDTPTIKAAPAVGIPPDTEEQEEEPPLLLRASKVPSSRLGRLFHYGSLAASLSLGAASESIRRSAGSERSKGSVFMSDANVRRLVATLGRMRGAALKLGQFMSIQDNNMLPQEIQQVLHQVQAHANYMPDWQMEQVMRSELGDAWQSLFSSFDRTPIASASIGQVHKGVLASSDTPVAIKIQFPGIASSIASDLANISLLLRGSAILPRGMYLQNTIAVMRRELEDECDYVREAEAGRRFSRLLKGDDFFVVPKVIDELTTGKVLTTEWMDGRPLSRMKNMSQQTRDEIGTGILRLCLQELFQFRFMQTDPNWANFLYDARHGKLQLIDFGASREYTQEFMDRWYRLLKAAMARDKQAMREESEQIGYLTGEEGEEMVNAHLESMRLVASPFAHPAPYNFANQSITDSVRALIPIMLRQRLTPPPPETYSLNRKLSGAFLMCARLGATVDCKKLWEEYVGSYRTADERSANSQGVR